MFVVVEVVVVVLGRCNFYGGNQRIHELSLGTSRSCCENPRVHPMVNPVKVVHPP